MSAEKKSSRAALAIDLESQSLDLPRYINANLYRSLPPTAKQHFNRNFECADE